MKTISAKTPEKLFTTMTVGLLLLTLILHASLVSAHGGRNDECNDGDDIAPINASLATYTAPLDQIVTGVCIKAGNTPFGDGHSDALGNGSYENGCFSIAGVGTQTVVVTRNFESNQCQGISHIDVYLGKGNQTPTNTPTPVDTELSLTPTPTLYKEETTPTPTDYEQYPTQTPSPTPEEDDDNGRNIDLTPTPTTAPTVTATPASTPTSGPTATPTPGATGGGSNDNPGSTSGTSSTNAAAASTGQVLGATTLGATGSFTEILMNIMFYTGCILIGVAALGYGSTKKRS